MFWWIYKEMIMCSAPVIKPLGVSFQGHLVWPAKDRWFSKFWYKARVTKPMGVRMAQFTAGIYDFLDQQTQHSTRCKRTEESSILVYFSCYNDFEAFMVVYQPAVTQVDGPVTQSHIDGILRQHTFYPRAKPWYNKFDTKLENKLPPFGTPLEVRKEMMQQTREMIVSALGKENVTTRGGGGSWITAYYVNWENIEPVLAMLKLSGTEFNITRLIINDNYGL